jgi:translation initiation factor 2 subunit 3
MSTNVESNQSEADSGLKLDMEDIMQNQAVMNLGMVGHVANGKTTVTGYVTGIATNKYASEKKQNKTIRLGYANFKVWRCSNCNDFGSTGSAVFQVPCNCRPSQQKSLINHISIVDCPGHNMLMSTMLNGSSVMDYTMLVESVTNKDCPAPQTAEHFRATKIAGIPNAMILMNKIDIAKRSKIVSKMDALEKYIREETGATDETKISPMIPISATRGTNLDVVCEYLTKLRPPRSRDPNGIFEMLVIRSFDVNRPGGVDSKSKGGTDVRKIKGGVIGGSIMRGHLRVGDRLVVLPGRCQRLSKDDKAKHETEADFSYSPIRCVVRSIQSEKNDMKLAIAGGLLGIQTSVDPAHTRNDGMTGSVVLKEEDYIATLEDDCPYRVYDKIIIKMENFMIDEERVRSKLPKDSVIKVNVNSNTIRAMVLKYSKKSKELRLFLVQPIPITALNDYITVMLDTSKQNTQPDTDIEEDLNTSVLGAGRIIDGIEAMKV